jgi:transcription initiation factor TFIIH subunit 2
MRHLFYQLIESNIKSTHCYGCQTAFPPIKKPQTGSNSIISEAPVGTQRFVCPSCRNHYCIDCDLYCHEVLHNCPGCERLSQGINGFQNGKATGDASIDSDAMIID